MNADGSDPRQISQASTSSARAWSPDGQKLVFDYDGDPSTAMDDYLFIAGVAQGTVPAKLTSATRMQPEREPNWAPASKIVFDDGVNIFTIDADGFDLVNVTQYSAGQVGTPRLTRDGQMVVFSRDEGMGAEIWAIPARGGVALQLTHVSPANSERDSVSDVSDDGKLVAYVHGTQDRKEVGVVSIDGRMNHSFNAPRGVNAVDPKFSPCR